MRVTRFAWGFVLVSAALAQRHGGGGGGRPTVVFQAPPVRTFGSPTGFGNILYPGVGSPPPGNITDPSFAGRLGGSIAGFGGIYNGGVGSIYTRPGQYVQGRGRSVVVPYAVPVYVGGYDGYGYAPQEPNVTLVMPQQPSPSVIINQNFIPEAAARLSIRDYSKESLPESQSSGISTYTAPTRPTPEPETAEPRADTLRKPQEASLILIAYQDGSIHQAVGYSIEGDTLSYVTPKGGVNRASLNLVDTELTEKLNRERGIDVRLGR